jgi:hypothetical protein
MVGGWLALAVSLGTAGSAQASRITLSGDERINDFFSGMPGIDFATPSTGVDYDEIGGGGAHPGQVVISGSLSSMNYHETGAPAVNINDAVDLDFTLTANITGILAVNIGGSIYDITLTFGTSTPAAGVWDLIVTDPDDSDTVIFRGDLRPGKLSGQALPALRATGFGIDIATNAQPVFQGLGFFDPDFSSEYGSLFEPESGGDPSVVGLSFAGIFNFSPDFTVIGDELVNNSTLISHTAQATGSVFGITTNVFTPIPEPGTGLLVGMGLLGFAAGRRRRD